MANNAYQSGGGVRFSRTVTHTVAAFMTIVFALLVSVTLFTPSPALAATATQDNETDSWIGKYGDTVTLSRLAGEYANETAAAISEQGFDSSQYAIIARDDNFADALGASGLAGTLDCPILLTDCNKLSQATIDELKRLEVETVYIIGGPGALSTQIETDLKAISTIKTSERVFGDAAWDTSLECAKLIEKLGGNAKDQAIVAMSSNFQDALSISTYAYKYQVPLILEDNSGNLTDEAVSFIEDSTTGIIFVPGGPGAVPESSVEDVFTGRTIERIYGEDGYDTSNQIALYMVENDLLSANVVGIACGAQKAHGVDALAGAALVGKQGGVMLLVNAQESMEAVNYTTIDAGKDSKGGNSFLTANKEAVKDSYVLGGTYVSPAVFFDKVETNLVPEEHVVPANGWSLDPATCTYDGTAQTPKVVAPNENLKEGTDYTVAYANNTNAGTATITITGKGEYTGTATVNFTISPKSIKGVTVDTEKLIYSGYTQTVTITKVALPDDTELSTSDYTISGNTGKEAKEYDLTITGVGNYTGTETVKFTISPKSIASAKITTSELTYNGGEQTAEITAVVLPDGTELAEDDYTASNNTGTDAKTYDALTITGTGNYTGTATGSFVINPKTVGITWEPEGEASFYYDGETHTPTASIEGVAEGEELTVVMSYANSESTPLDPDSAPSALGSYIATVTGLTAAAGTSASNYVLPEEGLSKDFDIVRNKYWLATAGAENPEAATVFVKTQGQIDEDMAVLHGTKETTSTGNNKAAVETEYKNYMNGKNAAGETQEVRLYTKWNLNDANTDVNKWVEFRIIQVGEHLNDSADAASGDGSAVTFMATHALPTKQQMNAAKTNTGGWEASTLRTTMNDANGYVMTGLSDLAPSVKAVTKKATGGEYYNMYIDDRSKLTDTYTTDTFWTVSYSELCSENTVVITDTENWGVYRNEGSQYSWFTNKITNVKGSNSAIEKLSYTRDDVKLSPYWWSRSFYLEKTQPYNFGGVGYDGNPTYPVDATTSRAVVPAFCF